MQQAIILLIQTCVVFQQAGTRTTIPDILLKKLKDSCNNCPKEMYNTIMYG